MENEKIISLRCGDSKDVGNCITNKNKQKKKSLEQQSHRFPTDK